MEKIPNIEKIDNEKALRDIERGICEPLYRPEEIDFVEITKRAKRIIRESPQISDEVKKLAIKQLKFTLEAFRKNREKIPLGFNKQQEAIYNIKEAGKTLFFPKEKSVPEELLEKLVLKKYSISHEKWEELSKINIEKPKNDVLYRGGVARVIARKILGLKENHNELPITDIDLFILKKPDAWQIAKKMKANFEGIRFLDDLEAKTIVAELKDVDCFMNQIAISNKELLISEKAIEELKTGIIKPSKWRQNIYGINCYIDFKDNAPIFTEKALGRLIKFVAEGKAKGFEIEKHNLQINPIDSFSADQLLVLLKRTEDKPEEKRNETLFRLGVILEKMGVIKNKDMLFNYLKEKVYEKITRKNLSEFTQEKPCSTREAKWLIQIVKLTKSRVEEVIGIAKTILTGYKREEGDREKVIISVPEEIILPEEFIKQAQEWRKFMTEIKNKEK